MRFEGHGKVASFSLSRQTAAHLHAHLGVERQACQKRELLCRIAAGDIERGIGLGEPGGLRIAQGVRVS